MSQELKEAVFYRKLSDIKELYEKVKYAVILSENFDPERKFFVASCNQLRSALDHIFKAIDEDVVVIDYELKEVAEHLNRAGYDTYEILASHLYLSISETPPKLGISSFESNFLTIKSNNRIAISI